jgi:hypothetical protein
MQGDATVVVNPVHKKVKKRPASGLFLFISLSFVQPNAIQL